MSALNSDYLLESTKCSAFRLLLGREPNDAESAQLAEQTNFSLLRTYLSGLCRAEADEVERRTATRPVSQEDVILGFLLLIGRYPDGPAVIKSMLRSGRSTLGLVEGLRAARGHLRQRERQEALAAVDPGVPVQMVFLHVPRCSGTSFDDFCRDALHGNYYLEREEPEFDVQRIRGKRLVGGHFRINFWDALRSERIFLAILRHPVERALSLFHYYSVVDTRPEHAERQLLRKQLGFRHDQPLATMLESNMANEFTGNAQCRYLSAQPDAGAALHAIRHNPFIVTTINRVEELAAHLQRHYGFGAGEYPRVNRAEGRPGASTPGLGNDVLKRLAEANAADLALFEQVRAEGLIDTVPEALRTRFRAT